MSRELKVEEGRGGGGGGEIENKKLFAVLLEASTSSNVFPSRSVLPTERNRRSPALYTFLANKIFLFIFFFTLSEELRTVRISRMMRNVLT